MTLKVVMLQKEQRQYFKGRPFPDNFGSMTLSNKSIKNDTTFIRALTSC